MNKNQTQYASVEAHCIMTYASRDGVYRERVWNSRDGVAPFVVLSRDGSTEMVHTEWHNDYRCPDWEPRPGDRVFIDKDTTGKPALVFYGSPEWENRCPQGVMAQAVLARRTLEGETNEALRADTRSDADADRLERALEAFVAAGGRLDEIQVVQRIRSSGASDD